MAEGSSLRKHVIKLVGYAQRLNALGFAIPTTLGTDILLASLPPSYNGFIMNYNMNGLDKTTDELFAMLKTAEASMQKDPSHVLAVMNTTSFKKKGKDRNAKSGGKTKAQVKTKTGPTKDSKCHYCKNKGHWKRNIKKYLGDMKNSLITVCINKLYEVNRQFHYFTFIGIIDTISIANGSQIGTGNSQNSKEKNE